MVVFEIANHEYGNIFALSVLGAIKQFQRAAIFDQIILYWLKFDQMRWIEIGTTLNPP